ncbi:MAG: hypothetical protein QOE97_3875 [Pseudonocardiales bacterium]|jgi:hypothetical protein|nr:hypothetical protein [Pseudonocardiales bacterium]
MAWFRRAQGASPIPPSEPEDAPEALTRRLRDLVVFVNARSGAMPAEAVVAARRVTDVARELLDDAAKDPTSDVHLIIAVGGIVDDYLPTTLNSYLALDPAIVDTPRPAGGTPSEHLVEQLDGLWLAGLDVLAAAQSRDVDRLVTQGNFLRTKFSGSDLDL